MSDLKPMDIYSSRMDIPFDLAVFSRGHKLCVEAVNLRRAIKDLQEAGRAVKEAQDLEEATEVKFHQTLDALRTKMEREDLL